MARRRRPKCESAPIPQQVTSDYTIAAVTISAVVATGKTSNYKTYVTLEGLEDDGYSWVFQLYLTEKARPILIYFLRKAGYPADLIEPELKLKKSALIGLRLKVFFEEREDWQYPSAVGFEREGETELEERLARLNTPTIQVNEDLGKELEWLDDL